MIISYKIHEVAPYINWIYFFHAWGFQPRFAAIAHIHGCDACRAMWLASFPVEERSKASEAMQLFKEAGRMLATLEETGDRMDAEEAARKAAGSCFRQHGRNARQPGRRQFPDQNCGEILPANADGDNLLDHQGEREKDAFSATSPAGGEAGSSLRSSALSDFIRPLFFGHRRPHRCLCFDRRPAHGADVCRRPVQASAGADALDRLAEAATEKMHEQVRKEVWGYAPDKRLSIPDLLVEKYQGIRPAVGYPSLPDQSVNFLLDELVNMKQIVYLTDRKRSDASACVGVRTDVCASGFGILFGGGNRGRPARGLCPPQGNECGKYAPVSGCQPAISLING